MLRSVTELNILLNRELLIDYMLGNENKSIISHGLDNTENFGCGDNKDEDYWNMVLEQALEEGYMKVRREGVAALAKGKKYLQKPKPFELKDEEEEDGFGKENGQQLEKFVDTILSDGQPQSTPQPKVVRGVTSQRKLSLIQAIDRRTALDEYASNHSLDFDEVLEDVESIIASGHKLNLSYFGEEILGNESVDELFEYFETSATDDIDAALSEYDGVYSPQELRIGRILWRIDKIK